MMKSQIVTTRQIVSPLGPVLAGVLDEGVCLLEFVDSSRAEMQLRWLFHALHATAQPGAHPLLDQLQVELDEYFSGARCGFTLPLVLPGTPFQQAVWEALRAIPYGETWSYQRVANHIGAPRAARAVGAANGRNPIAILVPCHRLVGSDGSLTGYGGGIWRKQRLLELEMQVQRKTAG